MEISDRKQVEEMTRRTNQELERRILERTRELEDSNRALLKEIDVRKELEEQLRQSEAYLAEAQLLSNVGSFSLTLPEGILTWSEETVRICDYPAGTPPSLDLAFARVHPEDVPSVQAVHEKAYRERNSMDFEHRLLMDDKSVKYVRVVARPARETKDSVTFVGAVMDLTRQKKAEQAIQASEQLARGQLDALRETLNSISAESNPDNLLQHVLCVISRQTGSDSISVFRADGTTTLTLLYHYQEGKLLMPQKNTVHFIDDQPVWPQAMALGECVLTELDRDPIWIRHLNPALGPGFPRFNDKTLPFVIDVHHKLRAQGVVQSLGIPMLTSGRVSGFMGLRFLEHREHTKDEVDLYRALAQQAALAIELTHLTKESQQAAVTEERNRMARDIHDSLAQGFTGVIAQLQATKGVADETKVSGHIEKAEALARESLTEARRSMRALRLEHLRDTGVSRALDSMFRSVGQYADFRVDYIFEGEERPLPPEWEDGLLRVAQESLTNAIKHSRAKVFHAKLSFDSDRVTLRLSDDGRGFNIEDDHEGFGLIGMKERAQRLGGDFTLFSGVGQGTEITMVLRARGDSEEEGD